MIAPARRAAFGALLAHEVKGTDLPAAIATARHVLHDARDQTLLTELVIGTVRMRLALDHQLGLRTSRPLAGLDDEVRTSLRMGAFQLMYLDRLPPSAVVDDAVSLTRRAGKSSAAGMVNAVLRALARERAALTWPETPEAHALAIRHSHPEWLVSRWLQRYGPEPTRAWLAFNNESPRLCLAANRLKATRDELAARLAVEGVDTVPTSRAPNGLTVVRGAALGTAAFSEGWFVVQDEASQLVAELGELGPGQRVLDLCAAPGGKTVALSARVGQTGRVVACDVRPRRVRLLKATLARTGLGGIPVVQIPAGESLPFVAGAFDFVFIDAPCSGLGTLRRDPDIRWRRQEADLVRLAAGQLMLLHRAAPLVRRGGTLLYATCSSEPDENEAVVSAFLADASDFVLRREHRTTPPDDGLEAFYGAVIARKLWYHGMLPMPISARVWTAGKILLLVGALSATFVAFAMMAARVAVRARDVAVPNLVGRELNEATAVAANLDLQLTVDETRRPDLKVPAGFVLGQEPPAGSFSRRQRSVRVWLSAGPRIARAPALVGESQRAAEIRIVQEGLQPGAVAEIRSALYPPDVVVAQDPQPGVETAEVRLLVNRGEDRASYVMPDLIGVNGERAADILRGHGFRVSITAQSAATGLPPGVVTRQAPAGGYQVHPGDAIALEVSR